MRALLMMVLIFASAFSYAMEKADLVVVMKSSNTLNLGGLNNQVQQS